MQRNCDSCSLPYTAQRPNSRFCSESCRKKASRSPDRVEIAPIPADSGGSSTRSRVLAELEAAGRAETYLGACALALAERIDQSTAVMGYAALIKELRSTMDQALEGVAKETDSLDELKRRRDAKRAG
ncbi:MAG: hypothetical protein ACXV3F_00250 [Frankiaceae bacterium]